MISSKDILTTLDSSAGDYSFPMIDNAAFNSAAIRLTSFRNEDEWLIIFQQLVFAPAVSGGFTDSISAYGNRIPSRRLIRGLSPVSLPRETEPASLNQYDFTISVHGGPARHFTPSVDDYRQAHVSPDDTSPAGAKILRYLTSRISDELFFADNVLLETCGRASSGLTKFIELNQWHHPDVAEDESPSENPCFKSLARALSRGDASLYKCPSASFNTDWWLWPTFR